MISIFRPPFPGELLWGAVARTCARFPAIGQSAITKLLFNTRIAVIHKLLPHGLSWFANNALPEGSSTEKVVQENTMFPFLEPFLEQADSAEIYAHMLSSTSSSTITNRSRLAAGYFDLRHYLRYCPKCVQQDREQQGVSFWRAMHQYQLLKLCLTRHHCDLIGSPVRLSEFMNRYITLDSVADSSTTSDSHSSALQCTLGNLLVAIGEHRVGPVGQANIVAACRLALEEKGFPAQGIHAANVFRAALKERHGERVICDLKACDEQIDASWDSIFIQKQRPVSAIHCGIICEISDWSPNRLLAVAKSLDADN